MFVSHNLIQNLTSEVRGPSQLGPDSELMCSISEAVGSDVNLRKRAERIGRLSEST